MSKKNVAVQSETETVNETQESMEGKAVYVNGSAIGIVTTPTGGYQVVKLEFNSMTGTARVVKTVDVGPSKLQATERFKILAVEEGLV